ncbi:hypothetical protein BJ322DRAFT_418044 [Thelephora terrestris]|uniref:Nephrocystin 3-like N-terminal domain-containing protein n=1 Tax=Thelephora terrestris TaxID=56493 RepID=A0A9P6HPI5_9AGAM|nr:hypothetical protein BJ322DRAFT_418044 [Thelephora terrestris]
MSTVLKKRRPTVSGVESEPTKKHRFNDAMRILLSLATDSADACPPLKSCLGGITALIKLYDETKDVEDKVGDLIPWLNKLKNNMTTASASGTNEETERREQLTRSLEDIEKRSQELLGKGKAARILDKARDSGIIVKLVEELRQAILIYQLSQQRSIDDQVAQLARSFGAFLELREKTTEAKGKIDSTLARLDRLKIGNSIAGDEGEFKRQKILFEALEGIKYESHCISERSSAAGYKESDVDTQAVCELAESVRDAVIEYQFSQQKALYEQNCKLIGAAEALVLNACRRAHGAGYQHGNRGGCLRGTRESVLSKIEHWAEDPEGFPVFWLNGVAGTGKSTIAQTVAERIFADGRLGASFFCSRSFEDRSNLKLIFPTLAFQLAQ